MIDQSVFELLSLSTIRIECQLRNGDISTGTRFFFKFLDDGNIFIPTIVTNKHVIKNADQGQLLFTLSDKDGNPKFEQIHKFKITNFQEPWLNHPDLDIDLCALPINVLVNEMKKKGIKPYFTFLDISLLPSAQDIDEMVCLERIVMVGYPNGLWDESHNQPVFRAGVLASHYKFDWNDRPEFVIDASCVPGSSGSPVLIIGID